MQTFRKSIDLDAGSLLGGYAEIRRAAERSSSLEVNAIRFMALSSKQQVGLYAVDALYPGDLVVDCEVDYEKRIYAASHTHYAPMLDATKPMIGPVDECSKKKYSSAINNQKGIENCSLNTCKIFRGIVNSPIYRRSDYPKSYFNNMLTKFGGMIPNGELRIDKNIYFFVFEDSFKANFIFIYHACHPVSRSRRDLMSPDFVGSIRKILRKKHGNVPCLFFQGCSGDIRPNQTKKRLNFLPKFKFNHRFASLPTQSEQNRVDDDFKDAVSKCEHLETFDVENSDFEIQTKSIKLENLGEILYQRLNIGNILKFDFIPFEVSHLFHLESQKVDKRRFIVSCSDATLGYLAHPTQLTSGGYEVDGSRNCMGLKDRVIISEGSSL